MQICSYTYDANGNQTYKALSEITPLTSGAEETWSLSLLSDTAGVTMNEYNLSNQLKRVENGDDISTYAYNADGLRKSKTMNAGAVGGGVTTKHIWSGSNIVAEANGSNAIIASYIRGIGLIARVEGLPSAPYIILLVFQ